MEASEIWLELQNEVATVWTILKLLSRNFFLFKEPRPSNPCCLERRRENPEKSKVLYLHGAHIILRKEDKPLAIWSLWIVNDDSDSNSLRPWLFATVIQYGPGYLLRQTV